MTGESVQEADASEQLLPCPFCGGTAHLLSYSLSAMAHCADCGASVAWQRGADAESAAIAGWNRRVPVDVPAPTNGPPVAHPVVEQAMREIARAVERHEQQQEADRE